MENVRLFETSDFDKVDFDPFNAIISSIVKKGLEYIAHHDHVRLELLELILE